MKVYEGIWNIWHKSSPPSLSLPYARLPPPLPLSSSLLSPSSALPAPPLPFSTLSSSSLLFSFSPSPPLSRWASYVRAPFVGLPLIENSLYIEVLLFRGAHI